MFFGSGVILFRGYDSDKNPAALTTPYLFLSSKNSGLLAKSSVSSGFRITSKQFAAGGRLHIGYSSISQWLARLANRIPRRSLVLVAVLTHLNHTETKSTTLGFPPNIPHTSNPRVNLRLNVIRLPVCSMRWRPFWLSQC